MAIRVLCAFDSALSSTYASSLVPPPQAGAHSGAADQNSLDSLDVVCFNWSGDQPASSDQLESFYIQAQHGDHGEVETFEAVCNSSGSAAYCS